MKLSQKALGVLKKSEGWVADVYLDQAGKPTIGYGHLISLDELSLPSIPKNITIAERLKRYAEWNEAAKKYPDSLSENQGEELLKEELAHFESGVDKLIDVDLSQGQFDALVVFAFNVGLGALEGSTLRKRVNSGDLDVEEEFLKWVKITHPKTGKKKTSNGLIVRRKKEVDLWNDA